jgi:hypothetical protein
MLCLTLWLLVREQVFLTLRSSGRRWAARSSCSVPLKREASCSAFLLTSPPPTRRIQLSPLATTHQAARHAISKYVQVFDPKRLDPFPNPQIDISQITPSGAPR